METNFRKTAAALLALALAAPQAGAMDVAERLGRWQAFVKAYEPDLSDSSEMLGPPRTGRLAKPVPLAKDGKALAEIVVDLSDAIRIENFFPDPSKWSLPLRYARGHETAAARTAAFALRDGLELLTGAKFPVRTSPSGEAGAKIFLGASFAKDLFPGDLEALASARAMDGFAVRESGGNLYIFGAAPAGTLYGVHAFLENNSDLIWAFPSPVGTVYTRTADLEAVWGDAREIPAFVTRGWLGGDDPWKMRNRSNFVGKDPGAGFFMLHGGHYLCPQYYDWCVGLRKFNSMDARGVRSKSWDEARHHACLSDPDFLPHALESVPNLKEIAYGAPYDCVFGMDDNAEVCHCSRCAAPIRASDGTMLTPEKDGELFWSAWFYTYLNKLDDAIQARNPGYVTSTFAYFFAKRKPPIEVNKTIVPWICNYPRYHMHVPVVAPENKVWQDVYEGWAKHSPDLFHYDYYGFLEGQPYAEIYKEDLDYQRSLGFLSTGTEGFMHGDFIGGADERWCVSRLAWNPDLDVEQLHRYFNRRAYREAAPFMDKIRGKVRQAYFRAGSRDMRKAIADAKLEGEIMACLDEAAKAVRHPGAKRLVLRSRREWADFLGLGGEKNADAEDAEATWHLKDNRGLLGLGPDGETILKIKNGKEEVVVPPKEAAGRLFRFRIRPNAGLFETRGYLSVIAHWKKGVEGERCESGARPLGDGTYSFLVRPPAGSIVATFSFETPEAVARKWGPPYAAVELAGIEILPDDGLPIPADEPPPPLSPARLKEIRAQYAREAAGAEGEARRRGFENFVADPLVPEGSRREILVKMVCERIAGDDAFSADDALALFRKHLDDQPARVMGLSLLMNTYFGNSSIGDFAGAFAARGDFAAAAAVYDAWIGWDGEKTPTTILWRRKGAKMAFLRSHLSRPAAKALYDAGLAGWKDFLRFATKDASTARNRGECELALLALEKDALPPGEYARRIETLLMDEFMANHVRCEAARLLPDAFRQEGKTDWKRVEAVLVAALESGDWSGLARTCYSRQSATDLRLQALVSVVQAMADDGEKDRASALLEKGAALLGYDKEPIDALKEENLTIPHTFSRATIEEIKGRYSVLEKARAPFRTFKFEFEDSAIIDLDE